MEDVPIDLLFDICSWVSVRDVLRLRSCCQKFQKILLSTQDAHWRRRIESTFPFNFQNILDQDLLQQLGHFACFRTLDSGNNISFISLPSATPTFCEEYLRSGPRTTQIKLPWADYTLLLSKGGSIFLFDVIKKVVLAKIDLTINNMWLDVLNKKVALVSGTNIKVYSLASQSFDFEYESRKSGDGDEMIFPLLSNCIIWFDGQKLVWFSLKTKQIERTHECANDSRLTSFISLPYIYEAKIDREDEDHDFIQIFQIDCAVQQDPVLITTRAAFNDGDIIQCSPSENGDGQSLQVYYLHSKSTAMDSFDVQKKNLMFRVHETSKRGTYGRLEQYESIQACLGDPNYYNSIKGDVVTIRNYERGRTLDLKARPYYWSYDFEQAGHSFPGSQWLTDDILDIQVVAKNHGDMDLFYSISKNKIVGFLKGSFTNMISFRENILAFNDKNEFYIIRLDTDSNDEYITRIFPPSVPKEEESEEESEEEDDDDEEEEILEPPLKRAKTMM
jgi:hypothetical protein